MRITCALSEGKHLSQARRALAKEKCRNLVMHMAQKMARQSRLGLRKATNSAEAGLRELAVVTLWNFAAQNATALT